MTTPPPPSITIEEAVARMINFGKIPPGHTLEDMTDLQILIAEEDLESALENKLPSEQIDFIKNRIKASEARHFLAAHLKKHIEWELETPENSILRVCSVNHEAQQS